MIRAANIHDLKFICELFFEEVNKGNFNTEMRKPYHKLAMKMQFRQILKTQSRYFNENKDCCYAGAFIFEEHTERKGFYILSYTPLIQSYEVYLLAVKDKYRGAGIGKKLLQHAIGSEGRVLNPQKKLFTVRCHSHSEEMLHILTCSGFRKYDYDTSSAIYYFHLYK